MVTIMKLILAIVISLQSLGVAWKEELLVSVSKPVCEEKCGNVSIPFPFGMGSSHCFLDGWFEMICHKNVTPPKLLLKRTQLEVLNISWSDEGYYSRYDYNDRSYKQVIVINAPIKFFNCGDREIHTSINLTGAPFSFSDQNVFVAVSCGVHASMDSSSGDTTSQIGCTSRCPSRDNRTAASIMTISSVMA